MKKLIVLVLMTFPIIGFTQNKKDLVTEIEKLNEILQNKNYEISQKNSLLESFDKNQKRQKSIINTLNKKIDSLNNSHKSIKITNLKLLSKFDYEGIYKDPNYEEYDYEVKEVLIFGNSLLTSYLYLAESLEDSLVDITYYETQGGSYSSDELVDEDGNLNYEFEIIGDQIFFIDGNTRYLKVQKNQTKVVKFGNCIDSMNYHFPTYAHSPIYKMKKIDVLLYRSLQCDFFDPIASILKKAPYFKFDIFSFKLSCFYDDKLIRECYSNSAKLTNEMRSVIKKCPKGTMIVFDEIFYKEREPVSEFNKLPYWPSGVDDKIFLKISQYFGSLRIKLI